MSDQIEKIEIDVAGQSLGRSAADIAHLLLGKGRVRAGKNEVAGVKVEISNVDQLQISDKKMESKEYESFSGYPGGLRKRKMSHVVKEHGNKEILLRAIRGMLPRNKLLKSRLNNITFI